MNLPSERIKPVRSGGSAVAAALFAVVAIKDRARCFRWLTLRTLLCLLLLATFVPFFYTFFYYSQASELVITRPFTFQQHLSIREDMIYARPLRNISTPHPCEGFVLPPPPADKKRTGPRSCPVCYLPVEQAMTSMPTSPSVSSTLKRLNYVTEYNLVQNKSNISGGSTFGGYPSLQQRSKYFDIKESMTVHCGFVKGEIPGHNTGFDFDDVDRHEMEQCRDVVVVSAIFGNYDTIKQPKNISEATKRHACFFMFVDEETEESIKNTTTLDNRRKVGLWRVVVIRNLPYADLRRTGKVPKLLNHRLFPNAQYSIWIDGKLELVEDPYRLLERFLWREKRTFAISKHYSRPDVFLEGEANIKAKKYDNASIHNQLEFYKSEGLTPYSQAKLPIESDVPEGCVIIRELAPITNLFTCFWFNEVDRFTPRDQLSFATVRNKIMARVDWSPHMFQDCERRNFVNQAYHTDVMKEMAHPPPPPSPVVTSKLPRKSLPQKSPSSKAKKLSIRPDRDRKAGSGSRKIGDFNRKQIS